MIPCNYEDPNSVPQDSGEVTTLISYTLYGPWLLEMWDALVYDMVMCYATYLGLRSVRGVVSVLSFLNVNVHIESLK